MKDNWGHTEYSRSSRHCLLFHHPELPCPIILIGAKEACSTVNSFFAELSEQSISSSRLWRSSPQEGNSVPSNFNLQRSQLQSSQITHNHMTTFFIIILVLSTLYIMTYFSLSKYVEFQERVLIDLFLGKIGKIPALIEVMRPYVAEEKAFDHIIKLHTQAMIQEFRTLYDILGLNGKIQNDFLFLMQLSVQIPKLQKDEYFVYIRDFVIEYEWKMRTYFLQINRALSYWNTFVRIKNLTGIGYFLPGTSRTKVR